MPKINVLPGAVSELIAAGEVIERPASIVKELVENSIDAGASTITVEIQNGGVRYLRVTDNGCGIAPEDAATAFLRHATSKVRDAADLDRIGTLGFRGEALASIAAVAHVEMLTKTMGAEIGTLVKISASQVEAVTEAGCPQGTTLVARDIFYNVPARLKFLKKDVSEANAVESIVEKIALSHPEISIKFIRDNRTAFHTPGDGKLLSVIYTIFGREFSRNLMPVEYALNGIRVTGYAGKPMYSRANRSMQHFFINGRYTKTKTGGVALEEAYRSSIMAGKFPCCVLQLEMPYDQVDVNVHPAKIEVRFVSEKAVFDAVYFAVKSAIAQDNVLASGKDVEVKRPAGGLLSQFEQPEGEQQALEVPAVPVRRVEPEEAPPPRREVLPDAEPHPLEGFREPSVADAAPAYRVSPERERAAEIQILPSADPEKEPAPVQPPRHRVRIIGELFFTYVLAQIDETFAIVDKHAAHERILYNRLKESRDGLEKQYLLTSAVVTLSKAEHQCVLDRLEALDRLGFTVEDFGGSAVVLRSVPAVAGGGSPREMFLEIAASMAEMRRQQLPEVVEDILHRIACRSAVKGGDLNSPEELRELVEIICADENVRYCPHGRPVILQYTRAELEKLFGRIP